MEVINKLLDYKNLKIVQNTQMFKFSLDSILLPNFIDYKVKYKRILDIGTGSAPIPLIISQKSDAKIDAIEVQKEVFKLAQKTVKINNLEEQIHLINKDVLEWYKTVETDTYDLIVCNPPYFKNNNKNSNQSKSIARHEEDLSLDSIFKIARKILINNGRIVLVHRTNRFIEIINLMQKHNIEPKRCQFIYTKLNHESNIMLIEGTKNGRIGFKLMDPLYVHNEDGSYADKIKEIFR